jgi:hypothetical protein
MERKKGDLQVWWIPQVPGKPFTVDVATLAEGVKLMDVLADYDRFQYENRIKPDYCNVGGINVYVGPDSESEDGWESWEDEETGEDDPRALLGLR